MTVSLAQHLAPSRCSGVGSPFLAGSLIVAHPGIPTGLGKVQITAKVKHNWVTTDPSLPLPQSPSQGPPPDGPKGSWKGSARAAKTGEKARLGLDARMGLGDQKTPKCTGLSRTKFSKEDIGIRL